MTALAIDRASFAVPYCAIQANWTNTPTEKLKPLNFRGALGINTAFNMNGWMQIKSYLQTGYTLGSDFKPYQTGWVVEFKVGVGFNASKWRVNRQMRLENS